MALVRAAFKGAMEVSSDGGVTQLRVLADSYHMICIDNEREDVAQYVRDFLLAQ
jgi:esterase/lipase